MVLSRRDRIHWSTKLVDAASTGSAEPAAPSRRPSAKRTAFHTLFEKLRPPSNFDDVLRARGASSDGSIAPAATPYALTIFFEGSPGLTCSGAAT